MYRADLSRRLGPAFADAAVDAAFESLDKPSYPAGWGTSPRPAPTSCEPCGTCGARTTAVRVVECTRDLLEYGKCMFQKPAPAKAYKPAHGGYPGTPTPRNPQPFC